MRSHGGLPLEVAGFELTIGQKGASKHIAPTCRRGKVRQVALVDRLLVWRACRREPGLLDRCLAGCKHTPADDQRDQQHRDCAKCIASENELHDSILFRETSAQQATDSGRPKRAGIYRIREQDELKNIATARRAGTIKAPTGRAGDGSGMNQPSATRWGSTQEPGGPSARQSRRWSLNRYGGSSHRVSMNPASGGARWTTARDGNRRALPTVQTKQPSAMTDAPDNRRS